MKKMIIILLTVIVPLMFFLEVWGVFYVQRVTENIEKLESTQNEWLDKNKKLIAAIAVYSSPDRVEKLAKGELGLMKISPDKILKIILSDGEE